MKPRMLVWFSCGAPSACAARESILRYGTSYRIVVVSCDTRPSEHQDNYRFSREVESWIGQPIVHIRNEAYRVVDDVFNRHHYMSGVRGARCTTELKKIPRKQFALADDTHVFGFTADESRRVREFASRNPDLILKWTLVEAGMTRHMCLGKISRAGIALPAMYALGFDNNNCLGCVKASSPWYWSMIRKHFPDVFARRCEQSRRLNVRLVEIHHHVRIFLDELPDHVFPKKRRKENLSCGPECAVPFLA
jgi:hypothetical protein